VSNRWLETFVEGGQLPSLRWIKPWVAPTVSVLVLVAVLVRADLGAAVDAFSRVPVGVLLVGLGLLLIRDLIADVGCWQSTLAAVGVRAGYRTLLGITVEYAPLKFLLPFKFGDALRVLALNRRAGVPAATGVFTRLAAMVLQLAVLVAATALMAAVHAGHVLVAVFCGICVLGIVVALVRIGIGGRLGPMLAAVMFAALSVGCSVGLYAAVIPAVSGAPLTAADVLVITATVLACSLPATARGIGLRELMLTTFAVSWGVGVRSDLLGAALVVSATEVGVVLAMALGVAAYRVSRRAG
jgi:hypothetical protein